MEHEEQRGAFICNTWELLLTRKLVTLIPAVPEAACIHCSIFVIIRTATCDQTSPRSAHAHTPSTFSASIHGNYIQYLQSFEFSVWYNRIHDLWCSIGQYKACLISIGVVRTRLRPNSYQGYVVHSCQICHLKPWKWNATCTAIHNPHHPQQFY